MSYHSICVVALVAVSSSSMNAPAYGDVVKLFFEKAEVTHPFCTGCNVKGVLRSCVKHLREHTKPNGRTAESTTRRLRASDLTPLAKGMKDMAGSAQLNGNTQPLKEILCVLEAIIKALGKRKGL